MSTSPSEYVKQLIYNFYDYDNSGKSIYSDKTGTAIVYDKKEAFDIYTDLLSGQGPLGGKEIVKLGIQAPPGTKIKMNTISSNDATLFTVIVGRSGIYELDDADITIKMLYFEEQSKRILDKDATVAALEKGKLYLNEANNIYNENKINSQQSFYYKRVTSETDTVDAKTILNKDTGTIAIVTKDSTDFENPSIINCYQIVEIINNDTSSSNEIQNIILKEYNDSYAIAWEEYQRGVHGIFLDKTQTIEPKNVIIDCVYKDKEVKS